MEGDKMVQINQANWQQEVMEFTGPVLVDFWAEWCRPCLAMNPVLEALSTELAGRLKVAKVNVDENPELSSKFGIRSIPTMLLMKGGEIKEQLVGSINKDSLKAKISAHL